MFSKKTATSRTDSSVLATISEFPRTCPHLFTRFLEPRFWIPGCQQTARFPSVYLFRPAYIYPVQPQKVPNFSHRLLRAMYPAFQLLFPNQVIRADDLARAMVDVAVQGTERGGRVFENRDIRAMVKRTHPSPGDPASGSL